MAAFKSMFNPELQQKLKEKERYLVTAAKAISQFARFPGPDDLYYFRLAKITVGVDRKTQGFKFNFKFVCVANVKTRSAEFAGSPFNITFRCFASKNMTEDEAWARFYTDGLQALGIPTQKWPKEQARDLLDQALFMLQETKPPVTLQIRTSDDKKYQNANITEVLRTDALDEFTQPSYEVADEMPDDEHDEPDPTKEEQLAALKARLETLDKPQLIGAVEQQHVACASPASLTEIELRTAIYKHFEIQLLGEPQTDVGSVEEVLEGPVEEVLESVVDLSMVAIQHVTVMDRKPVQLAIRSLDPAFKFYPAPTHTDQFLKEELLKRLSPENVESFLKSQNVPW